MLELNANMRDWINHLEKGDPHINVCWEIDIKCWKALLFSALQ